MHCRSAWVTLTGKVFVDNDEMEDWLKEKYPDLLTQKEIEEDDIGYLDKCSVEQEREAFEDIAYNKIEEKYGMNDEPMKLDETCIDMTTYRS
jgi:hypothetical protein